MFELFEHTADLGLRVRAPDLESLFREAGEGFFSMIVEDWSAAQATREFGFELDAERHDDLLFDWLNELLYTFDTTRCLLGRFELHVTGTRLAARAWGAPLDLAVHRLLHEVKAITYHGLKVEPTDGGWLAEVIVDI
jgi:SHS2 domain-containing protein